MKKLSILVLVFFACMTMSIFSQGKPTDVTKTTPSKLVPQPAEPFKYHDGTYDRLKQVYGFYNDNKFADAEKKALELLQYEPNCMEAKWILAYIYKQKGEVGNVLAMLAATGIREAKESSYERQVIYAGSKGYVLQVSKNLIRVDYNNAEVKPGDPMIVYVEGAVLRHPITLQIIYVEKRLVAEVEIKNTSDSHSTAEIVQQSGDIAPAMRVIPKADYNGLIDALDNVKYVTPNATAPSTTTPNNPAGSPAPVNGAVKQ